MLAVTQRIPGVELAMAQGVDEAIGRFPAVLDMLGNEQVSAMDGCARETAVCVTSVPLEAVAARLANMIAVCLSS